MSVGDVWYIKAENTVCRLVTTSGVFCCRLPLGAPDQTPFLRIHKSYLCSPAYVHSPRCCRIVVQNGAELPVGKERYNDVKLILRQSV
ncbi:MAG: LytTR family DNA-binding domain-containing protein [Oscillibacter sp.]|nr:LytTR family DNA-binding domain-containing protein [Oscillibacter sp.]